MNPHLWGSRILDHKMSVLPQPLRKGAASPALAAAEELRGADKVKQKFLPRLRLTPGK